MIRTEAGRRGEDDEVAALDDLLVGVGAGEDAGVIDLHLLGSLVAQVAQRTVGLFFEGVGDGMQGDALLASC
jgi:hypothetical protein